MAIPQNTKLYTWIDVEEVLYRSVLDEEWPEDLLAADGYWDALKLVVREGSEQKVLDWLQETFEPRIELEPLAIRLESVPGKPRPLPIYIEAADKNDKVRDVRFSPSLARPPIISRGLQAATPSPIKDGYPPVVAFHSFKGGVGRTLSALTFALLIARRHRKQVLLIDADLEAPGLTWIFQDRFPILEISLTDMLALVHGDPDPTANESVRLVADRLRSMKLDGLYGMPAFRVSGQFQSLDVRPEHLIRGAEDPFVLTNLFSFIGKELDVAAVVVDLRAGLSELSSGLLLDPRVHRVLVTTLSDQSLKGTAQELDIIGRLAPVRANTDDPVPALIFSRVPSTPGADRLLDDAKLFLMDHVRDTILDDDSDEVEAIALSSAHDQRLMALPGDWEEVLRRIEHGQIMRELAPLTDWLQVSEGSSEDLSVSQPDIQGDVDSKRERLSGFAKDLIYAERGVVNEFLSTPPLENMAQDFTARVPIVVVVGSKGSGKTYTYLQLAYRKTWDRFTKDAGISDKSLPARVCPMLMSKNIEDKAKSVVEEALAATITALGESFPAPEADVLDVLRDTLEVEQHEGKWRETWLTAFAMRLGLGEGSSGSALAKVIAEGDQSVVLLIDGLEDLFQELASVPAQQTALRALLQDVPNWLDQQPERKLGLVVFVRRDMVFDAVRQNPGQLIARYEPYALKWSPEEALRLVVWVSQNAGVLGKSSAVDSDDMDKQSLVDILVPLWGRKLGSERSREARSADWVIAALSDLKGQVQARDLVRFLHESSQASIGDTYWRDRILSPKAIRSAVEKCSVQKIEEIKQENRRLDEVFGKLERLPPEQRQIPFTDEEVGLTTEDLRNLEDNGAVLKEGDKYYMPEIFRLGLNFKLKRGARPRVMLMAQRARR